MRFASGQAAYAVAEEVAELGAQRIMLIAGDHVRTMAEAIAEHLPVSVWHDEVVMHVPTAVAERARQKAIDSKVDALVSIGGGSATGLAKAIALTSGLPIVAVPTTYAGSEATNVWGMTESGKKTTGINLRVLPRTVVYDAALTVSLPVDMSVASGLNAMAHCIDSMWSPNSDPIDRALASEGIRAVAAGLLTIVSDPPGLPGREQTIYGAYLSAMSLCSAGSGLHHKICHVLGGMFNMPHAQTHSVMLPYVLAFNAPNAPEAECRIADALGADGAVAGLRDLYARLDAPRALRDYGVTEEQVQQAVGAIVEAAPDSNPTAVTGERISELLEAAWKGEAPS